LLLTAGSRATDLHANAPLEPAAPPTEINVAAATPTSAAAKA
jgi:hypothetical protein